MHEIPIGGYNLNIQIGGHITKYPFQRAVKTHHQRKTVHKTFNREKYKHSYGNRSTNTQLEGAVQTATRGRSTKPQLDEQ